MPIKTTIHSSSPINVDTHSSSPVKSRTDLTLNDKRLEAMIQQEISDRIAGDAYLQEQIDAITLSGAHYLRIEEHEDGQIDLSLLDGNYEALDTKSILSTGKLIDTISVDVAHAEIIFNCLNGESISVSIVDILDLITAEEDRAKEVEDGIIERLSIIEADYLTSADKEELESEINFKASKEELTEEISRATEAESSISQRVATIENDYLTSSDKAVIEQEISVVASDLTSHTSNKNNPHQVTKAQVGLGNVDNTSDINKPISNATQDALDQIGLDIIQLGADISSVDAKVVQESSDRQDADSVLQSDIAKNAEDISSEATARQNADISLQEAINARALVQDLTNETTAREAADSQLQTNIDAKQDIINSSNKLSADLVDDTNTTHKFATTEQLSQIAINTSAISSETTRAEQAESSLDGRLDDIEEVIPSDATSSNPLATEQYVDENGGKIDKIEVNSVEQTITNKTVNITVPTKTSDITNDSDFTTKTYVDNELEDKVDKEAGKGLSTNDFTNTLKNKLDNIEDNAQVNVQANWNESDSSSDAYIQNKPSIPTATSDLTNDGDSVSPFATESYVDTHGGKIDKIQAQGVDLPINNKTVNITKASLDIDDIENVIPSNATTSNKLVAENEIQYLDSNVHIEGNTDEITYNGDTVTKTSNWKNLKTGSTGQRQEVIHLANGTTAGMMSPADYTQIRTNTSRIEALEGQTKRLLYTASTNPTQQDIGTFVDNYLTSIGITPSPEEYQGIAVVVAGTYHIWHYYNTEGVGWKDDGLDTVTQFSNSSPGVIQGKQADGFVYAENDGTGSVYGWSQLKARVSNNEDAIGSLQTDKQDKIDSNNLLDADLVDDSSSTNKFVTSQILTDITNNTSARHTHNNKSILDEITASYTTEEKTKLSGIESGAQVNKLESISVNGTPQTITDKNIDLTITDTGATSVEPTGSGNAFTGASYDASTRKITLVKGETFALDSDLYNYSTNIIIDEQTSAMSFAITSDVFNKLKTSRYATITLTNPIGVAYTFHKLGYANYDNVETITFTTEVNSGSNLTASVAFDGTNYTTLVEMTQVSATASGTTVGSYKRLDSITVDNQTYDLSHTYEKAFTDGSATIASLANDIITLKAGVNQTDGSISNNSDSDITLAKVAKTGSYNDLSDKPTIPTAPVQDVTVNGTSVLDDTTAKVLVKTINGNSIVGTGNLDTPNDNYYQTPTFDNTNGALKIATGTGVNDLYVPQATTSQKGLVIVSTGLNINTDSSSANFGKLTLGSHASANTTYGVGSTTNYGHVKLATGDMNGATHTDGVAVSKNHTHSQYVLTTRKVNGKALSSDITLSASDVSALPSDTTYVSSVNGNSGAITNVIQSDNNGNVNINTSLTTDGGIIQVLNDNNTDSEYRPSSSFGNNDTDLYIYDDGFAVIDNDDENAAVYRYALPASSGTLGMEVPIKDLRNTPIPTGA